MLVPTLVSLILQKYIQIYPINKLLLIPCSTVGHQPLCEVTDLTSQREDKRFEDYVKNRIIYLQIYARLCNFPLSTSAKEKNK